MSGAPTKSTRKTGKARVTIRAHGVEHDVKIVASYLVHDWPRLEHRLERLDPVHHQREITALTKAVATAFWHRCPGSSRAERLTMARDCVYSTLVHTGGHC